jgi:hypothetical protein
MASPVRGPKGNVEFLVEMQLAGEAHTNLAGLVEAALAEALQET